MDLRTVVMCRGHRCAALLPDGAGSGCPGVLQESIARSDDAVLVSTDCVGLCARSPVVGLGRAEQQGARLVLTVMTWLGPVGSDEVAALAEHVAGEPTGAALPERLSCASFVPGALLGDVSPSTR